VAYPISIAPARALYSIIPGPSFGITVNAVAGPTDIITVNYADDNLPLNCYQGTMNATGTAVNFYLPANWATICTLPLPGELAPPSLIYSTAANAVGLQVGDMIMFGTNTAVGIVTGAAAACPPAGNLACYTVPFAAGDPGNINQPGTATGSLVPLENKTLLTAVRLISVTYYLAIPPSTGLPTLMRIQSGQFPAPVAENVSYLKFTYDVINGAGTVYTNQATLPAGTTISRIWPCEARPKTTPKRAACRNLAVMRGLICRPRSRRAT
jgi:hypothetical protein